MRNIQLLLPLTAALLVVSSGAAQSSLGPPHANVEAAVSSAVIRPGDAVQITVWRKPELSGEFPVSADGSIAHPFYQEVNVGGVSSEVAGQRVQRFLEQYETSPRVRVDPLYRVSVAGHVRQPKLYSLRPEFTIADAIDEAGGPADRGRPDKVTLYRNGTVQHLELSGIGSATEIRIQSGDRIVVERRTQVLRDIVVPGVGFVGSLASLVHVWLRFRR